MAWASIMGTPEMSQVSWAMLLALACFCSACSESQLVTGSIGESNASERELKIDTAQAARLEPMRTLKPEIK